MSAISAHGSAFRHPPGWHFKGSDNCICLRRTDGRHAGVICSFDRPVLSNRHNILVLTVHLFTLVAFHTLLVLPTPRLTSGANTDSLFYM